MANWITLPDTKTFLGITDTSQDTRINLIIPAIQQMIINIIGDISEGPKQERIKICDITCLGEFFLNNINIISLDKINNVTYTGVLGTDYIIQGTKLTVKNIAQYLINLEFISVIIEYTAGFTDIPADIKEIMYILVGQELNKKEGGLIKRYTLGPRTVELDNSNGEADNLINSINAVLGKYKVFNLNLS